jgi:hypothetical protein
MRRLAVLIALGLLGGGLPTVNGAPVAFLVADLHRAA